MPINWAHAGPVATAAFLASIVEFVEALTVVLAVGAVRGWRDALIGAGAALLVLLALVAILGSALTNIPLNLVRLVLGTLLLLFGMRWLRKAILRAAGVLALHDEAGIYARQTQTLKHSAAIAHGWDNFAFFSAFKITAIEGLEVVFIVIAVGAGGPGLLWPASLGALAALLVVATLGVIVHKPLSRIPENTLKLVVGVLVSAFGCFWVGEGLGLAWPGDDWSILALAIGFLVTTLLCVRWCRARASAMQGARS